MKRRERVRIPARSTSPEKLTEEQTDAESLRANPIAVTAPAEGQTYVFRGGQWVPETPSPPSVEGGVAGSHASTHAEGGSDDLVSQNINVSRVKIEDTGTLGQDLTFRVIDNEMMLRNSSGVSPRSLSVLQFIFRDPVTGVIRSRLWGRPDDYVEVLKPDGVSIGNLRATDIRALGVAFLQDKIELSEITAPAGDPAANKGWLYGKDVGGQTKPHWESEDGTVTSMLGGGGSGTSIIDADADTKVDVEESADEDKIRMDVAGVERGVIQNASPHWAITGDVQMGTFGGGVAHLRINPSVTGAYVGIQASPSITTSGNSNVVDAVAGTANINVGAASSGHTFRGLNFQATMLPTGASADVTDAYGAAVKVLLQSFATNTRSSTVGNFAGLLVNANTISATGLSGAANLTLNATNAWGIRIQGVIYSTSGSGTKSVTVSTHHGIEIEAWTRSDVNVTVTTAYGLKIGDITGTSVGTVRLLEVGPATPNFRVEGKVTFGANLTAVWIAEGATPTLRQLRTKDGAAIGAGDLVCVLV